MLMMRHNPYFNRWFSAIKILVFEQVSIKEVTILILIDGFLQSDYWNNKDCSEWEVTILILIDGFLQYISKKYIDEAVTDVTILILIDGFLQYWDNLPKGIKYESHNPYFNRWFSAIYISREIITTL